jgi:hypothetical protein
MGANALSPTDRVRYSIRIVSTIQTLSFCYFVFNKAVDRNSVNFPIYLDVRLAKTDDAIG